MHLFMTAFTLLEDIILSTQQPCFPVLPNFAYDVLQMVGSLQPPSVPQPAALVPTVCQVS